MGDLAEGDERHRMTCSESKETHWSSRSEMSDAIGVGEDEVDGGVVVPGKR